MREINSYTSLLRVIVVKGIILCSSLCIAWGLVGNSLLEILSYLPIERLLRGLLC